MEIERVNYLSYFEEIIVEHRVAIQHVFGDESGPGFSYTAGLFEADHAEFIVFGMGPELAQTILNDLAFAVLDSGLRFTGNDRVHQLFQGATAHLVAARDAQRDYLTATYSIRDRRYPGQADTELDVLQLVYQDPAERWPWEPGSDYLDWPSLGAPPSITDARDVLIPRE